MDLDRVKEFCLTLENLGNPNEIVREKHTSELLKAIEMAPLQTLLECISVFFCTIDDEQVRTRKNRRRRLQS